MSKPLVPFNIDLLKLEDRDLVYLKEVTSLSIFDSTKQKFHDEGLFSNTIFGNVGTEKRNTSFAYINLKCDIFHPIIFKALVKARNFYLGIINGTEYATFSSKERDFVKATPIDGKTGFNFFFTHFKDLKLKDSGSVSRKQTIELLEKKRDLSYGDKILVLPAGLRDVDLEKGRPVVDEVNEYYQRILRLSNTISKDVFNSNPELIDPIRLKLQIAFNDLYDHLSSMVEGKKKLFLGKWASRRVFNGTRNVIVASNPSSRRLGDKNSPRFNSTIVGLYQYLKANAPVSKAYLLNSFLKDIFPDSRVESKLVDKNTLLSKQVRVDIDYFDMFQSDEGLDKLLNLYGKEHLRHKPVEVENHYLALVWRDNESFKVIHGVDEIPEGFDKTSVEPITLAQLMYIATYRMHDRCPGITVRYPITGVGSTMVTEPYVKSTNNSLFLFERDDFWNINKEDIPAKEFPITGEDFVNAMSVPPAFLGALGGDHDGDVLSLTTVYSDEAVSELKNYLQKRAAYISADGRWLKSVGYDTINFVCYNLSA